MADTDQFTDREIFAKTIYGEARNQSDMGMAAIAAVIINRSEHPCWWGGPDIRSVCLKPFQFSCWLRNDPNRRVLMNTPANDETYEYCLALADKAMAGELPDPTNGANSYYADTMHYPPKWAIDLNPVAHIGDHIFFKI